MSAKRRATELATLKPELPVVFMSGYPDDAAVRHGLASADDVLLNKPFDQRRLAEALEEVFDS